MKHVFLALFFTTHISHGMQGHTKEAFWHFTHNDAIGFCHKKTRDLPPSGEQTITTVIMKNNNTGDITIDCDETFYIYHPGNYGARSIEHMGVIPADENIVNELKQKLEAYALQLKKEKRIKV